MESNEEEILIRSHHKIAFTSSVISLCTCQFFLLNRPSWFWLWYSFFTATILTKRIFHFVSIGWEYFLFDFCYFVVGCTFINLLVVPSSGVLFKICFIFANGPLAMAIIIWRCGLVFHDFDKIITVYIHILPSMLYYAWKWHGKSLIGGGLSSEGEAPSHPLEIGDYFNAGLVYLLWQTCYYVKTEILDKVIFDKDPSKLSSLRWMTRDTKNPTARAVLALCKKMGFFTRDEEYDEKTLKTKAVFMTTQGVFTLGCFVVTPLCSHSQWLHLGFIIFIFITSVNYGASYYIDVFSRRYETDLKKNIESKNKGLETFGAPPHKPSELLVPSAPTHKAPDGDQNLTTPIDGSKDD